MNDDKTKTEPESKKPGMGSFLRGLVRDMLTELPDIKDLIAEITSLRKAKAEAVTLAEKLLAATAENDSLREDSKLLTEAVAVSLQLLRGRRHALLRVMRLARSEPHDPRGAWLAFIEALMDHLQRPQIAWETRHSEALLAKIAGAFGELGHEVFDLPSEAPSAGSGDVPQYVCWRCGRPPHDGGC